jgi:flavodoxin
LAMKPKKILLIVGVIAVIAVLAILAAMSVIIFDLWSVTAGGSETLNPAGNVTGHALVVYNPGITGGAKSVADLIANDLKADGFSVTLAGVKSGAASDVSTYDVIVAGGPIYAGNPSGSIKSYLQSLHPAASAKIGVFGFGTVKIDNSDKSAVVKDVASVPADTLNIKAAMKLTGEDDKTARCAAFVSELLA